jgi:hypothetical protein
MVSGRNLNLNNEVAHMNSVEDAYKELAKSVLDFVGTRDWDIGVCTSKTYSKMAQSSWYLIANGVKNAKAMGWGDSSIDTGGAALFLRDDLLRTTGQRIWGLTFTLFPDGQFKIEYDYNKPEGYEETDEVITGDEINASLAKLTGQDSKPS